MRPCGSIPVAKEARPAPTLCSRMRKACFNSTRGPRHYYAILNQPTEAVLSYPLQNPNQKGSPSMSPLLFLSVDITFNYFPCLSRLVPQCFQTALLPLIVLLPKKMRLEWKQMERLSPEERKFWGTPADRGAHTSNVLSSRSQLFL